MIKPPKVEPEKFGRTGVAISKNATRNTILGLIAQRDALLRALAEAYEACAKIADAPPGGLPDVAKWIAWQIRERANLLLGATTATQFSLSDQEPCGCYESFNARTNERRMFWCDTHGPWQEAKP